MKSFSDKDLTKFSKILFALSIFVKTESTDKTLLSIVETSNKELRPFYKALGFEDLGVAINEAIDYPEDAEPTYKNLRKTLAVLKQDKDVSFKHLDLIKSATSYLISNSDTAFNSLAKTVEVLDEQAFKTALSRIGTEVSQTSFVKPLQKIVKAFTQKSDVILSREDSIKLKEKFPKLHAEYLRLRKGFNDSWKTSLRNYVLASKKTLVDYRKALNFLKSSGIKHTLPEGFSGNIDAFGRFYTTSGRLLSNVPGIGFSVKMNPEYDAKLDNSYVFTTINDADGKVSQHIYTVNYKKKTTEEKFEKVSDLAKVIEPIRKKWLQSLKKSSLDPTCVASTVLELVYAFSARIGSINNEAGGQSTFGISTLQAKHFTKKGNKYLIKYLGKDAVVQAHLLEPTSLVSKLLIKNLDVLLEGKAKTDRVFQYEYNGRVKPMTGALVNKWFKKLGSEVTVHKLRHVRGTQLFNQLLEENANKIFNKEKPLTEAQANQVFKQLATRVGEMLGHVKGIGKQQKVTPATAIANYIDPGVMKTYFTKLGFRLPKYLAKFE